MRGVGGFMPIDMSTFIGVVGAVFCWGVVLMSVPGTSVMDGCCAWAKMGGEIRAIESRVAGRLRGMTNPSPGTALSADSVCCALPGGDESGVDQMRSAMRGGRRGGSVSCAGDDAGNKEIARVRRVIDEWID